LLTPFDELNPPTRGLLFGAMVDLQTDSAAAESTIGVFCPVSRGYQVGANAKIISATKANSTTAVFIEKQCVPIRQVPTVGAHASFLARN
jgi:hypothetical protein